jgi:hypothetical protein
MEDATQACDGVAASAYVIDQKASLVDLDVSYRQHCQFFDEYLGRGRISVPVSVLSGELACAITANAPTTSVKPGCYDHLPSTPVRPGFYEGLHSAAEQGDSDAQYRLGVILNNNANTHMLKEQAYAWMQKAAQQNGRARIVLARLQAEGGGALPSTQPHALTLAERHTARLKWMQPLVTTLLGAASDPENGCIWLREYCTFLQHCLPR